jgi:UDP-glucose:(heptosyl)LPS alpha-1,3-glucosyltransferase
MPTKLKIALITRRFGARYGGAEAYAEHLARVMMDNHHVRIFCQDFDSDVDVPTTRLPRIHGMPGWLNQLWFALLCHFHVRRGYDIVHSHENSWVGNVQVVHVMPVRYSLFKNGQSRSKQLAALTSPRMLTYLALEWFRFRARPNLMLIGPAQQTIDQLNASYRHLPPMAVITPAVTMPTAPLSRQAALEKLGLDPRAIYCLLVANHPVRKGVMTILSALETLDERFHLIVLGGAQDGPAKLLKVTPAALVGRVHVFPARPDSDLFYACADICVHPTLQDSFGMAPLEAMSFGLPVIMTTEPYCGLTGYIEPGKDALIMERPRDAIELATNISRIANDAGLRASLSENGRSLAARFDWASVEKSFVKAYFETLAQPPHLSLVQNRITER